MIYIGNTQSVSISFLFLFFFHQSSLYPIKIFAKCVYLFTSLYARFSVVGPIPFLLAAIFFGSSLYRKYYRTSRYICENLRCTVHVGLAQARPNNRDNKQCTRTTILCMRLVEASSLHAAR